MKHYKACLFVLIILQISFASADSGPSFNCSAAKTKVEKLICGSEHLSELDRVVADQYRQFIAELPLSKRKTAKSIQNIWIRNRGKLCGDKTLEECVKDDYYHWLNNISKGVLVGKYVLDKGSTELASPFDSSIKFKIDVTDSSRKLADSEVERQYHVELVGGEALNEGRYYSYGMEHYEDRISHLVFYLTKQGTQHMALQKISKSFGGRCGAFTNYSLNFVSTKNPTESLNNIMLYESDQACDTYEKQLFKWDLADNGSLRFYEVEQGFYYYQIHFPEIKVNEISSTKADQYYFVDESEMSFLGVSYTEIIEQVKNTVAGLNKTTGTDSCEIPGYGLSDYWQLKGVLAQHRIGFNQVEFYSNAFLKPEALKDAVQYKPLLEAALLYLNKARAVAGWEEKLVKAAKKYPQIQATANYYYNGDSNWETNPFVKAGFYTDQDCYAQQASLWSHASMEEWYYLFWARRLNDGNLERAENLLILLVEMMDRYLDESKQTGA